MLSLGHGDMLLMRYCFLFSVVKVNFVVSAVYKLGISTFNSKWGKEQCLFFLNWNQEFSIFVEFETELSLSAIL